MASSERCIGYVRIKSPDDSLVRTHRVFVDERSEPAPIFHIEGYAWGLDLDELWEELSGREFEVVLDSIRYKGVREGDEVHLVVDTMSPRLEVETRDHPGFYAEV